MSRDEASNSSPALHWKVTVGDPKLTRKNNFRIRLLTGCDGLEHDAAHFRTRSHYGALPGDSSCKLCNAEVEDPEHFVSLCPALSACRDDLLALATPQVRQSLPNPATHPSEFCDVILGTCWIDDLDAQKFCIEFLSALKEERAILLTSTP